MVQYKSVSYRVFTFCNYCFMAFLMLITIYPLLYVVFASISDPILLMGHNGLLYKPLGMPTLKGYEMTLSNPNIAMGYRNTIFYVVVGTLLNLTMTSMGAFVVTRKNFRLRNIMMGVMTLTMFFSGGLIPMFMLIRGLHLFDTPWAILLPGSISVFNLIIMRSFFAGIPGDLEEAAYIDGAGDWRVLWSIILPLSKPVIAVMVLYYGVGHWNSWFSASIYLRDRNLMPLQIFLREILMLSGNAAGQTPTVEMQVTQSYYKELLQYCTIIVATVPILAIYPFLQKYFVKGVMIGSIKG